jgi:peptidoglycan/xylan/chitin deacetylase (PgdA/CDA1 family)
MTRYIIRIDDIHPRLDWAGFWRLRALFERFDIKPLLSVIPENKDETLFREKAYPDFWNLMRELQAQEWAIGMHGYQHVYVNKEGGVLGLHKGSEFAGLRYEEQREKLRMGKEVLARERLSTDVFVAPGHAFDDTTVRALEDTGFRYISDGIAFWPFQKWNMVWIPQIAATPRRFPFGIITFCIHPQSFQEKNFEELESFLQRYRSFIVPFDWAGAWYDQQPLFSRKMHSSGNVFAQILVRFVRAMRSLRKKK